jgi:hypothetical protein
MALNSATSSSSQLQGSLLSSPRASFLATVLLQRARSNKLADFDQCFFFPQQTLNMHNKLNVESDLMHFEDNV